MELSPYLKAVDVPVPGKEWKVEAEVSVLKETVNKVHTILTVRAVAEERVRVPAGEFSTVKVEVKSEPIALFLRQGASLPVQLEWTYWYSPELRRVVRMSRRQYSGAPTYDGIYGFELASFQSAK